MSRKFLTKKAASAATATVLIPGSGNKQAVLTAYDLTSDTAADALGIKAAAGLVATVDAVGTTATANVAGQKVVNLVEAAGLTAADILIIQRADGSMERHVIDTGGVDAPEDDEITLVANLAADVAEGDKVYLMESIAAITIGNANVMNVAGGAYGFAAGKNGGPMSFEIVAGTTACAIGYVTVAYI